MTSRAKNWVNSDSQLSFRLIRLQLILRPDTQPSFFPHLSFISNPFVASVFPSHICLVFFILPWTHAKKKVRKNTYKHQYLHCTVEWLLMSRLQPVFKSMTQCEQWLRTERWSCSQEAESCSLLLCLRWLCLGTGFVFSIPSYLSAFIFSQHKKTALVSKSMRRNVHTVLCAVCVYMNNSGMMLMPVWNFIFKWFHTICSFKTHKYARRVFHNLF